MMLGFWKENHDDDDMTWVDKAREFKTCASIGDCGGVVIAVA